MAGASPARQRASVGPQPREVRCRYRWSAWRRRSHGLDVLDENIDAWPATDREQRDERQRWAAVYDALMEGYTRRIAWRPSGGRSNWGNPLI